MTSFRFSMPSLSLPDFSTFPSESSFTSFSDRRNSGSSFTRAKVNPIRERDCSRCGERFASQMHIQDLNGVLRELGFDYA